MTKATPEERAAIAERLILGPRREKQAFFQSARFQTLMTQFKDAAQSGPIGQDDVIYQTRQAYPFTADDFRKAFEAVIECAPTPVQDDTTGSFPASVKIYDGLAFTILFGQGSSYIIGKAPL